MIKVVRSTKVNLNHIVRSNHVISDLRYITQLFYKIRIIALLSYTKYLHDVIDGIILLKTIDHFDQNFIRLFFNDLDSLKKSKKSECQIIYPFIEKTIQDTNIDLSTNITDIKTVIMKHICLEESKIIQTNIKVHFKHQLYPALKNWYKNQLLEIYNRSPDYQKKYSYFFLFKKDIKKIPELKEKYQIIQNQYKLYQNEIKEILGSDEDDEDKSNNLDDQQTREKKIDLFKCFQVMIRMRKDLTGFLNPKSFAVIPQPNIKKIPFVTITSEGLYYYFKQKNSKKRKSSDIQILPEANYENMIQKNRKKRKRNNQEEDQKDISPDQIIKLEEEKKQKEEKRNQFYEDIDSMWYRIFDMNKINKLRKTDWLFDFRIKTNGYQASIQFQKERPKRIPLKELNLQSLSDLRNGYCAESTIFEIFQNTEKSSLQEFQNSYRFISIDPGINNPVTGYDMLSGKVTCTMSNKDWRHETKMNYYRYKGNQEYIKSNMSEIKKDFEENPYCHSIEKQEYQKYIHIIGKNINKLENYYSSNNILEMKARRDANRRRVMSKFIQYQVLEAKKIEKERGKKTIILFGNGNGKNQFGKMKNGKSKGPVMEIRNELSKYFPVIMVSEYCTSKLCIECGKTLIHPKHKRRRLKKKKDIKDEKNPERFQGENISISYCPDCDVLLQATQRRKKSRVKNNSTGGKKRFRFLDRDLDACTKIGNLFIGNFLGLEIGKWKRPERKQEENEETKIEDEKEDTSLWEIGNKKSGHVKMIEREKRILWEKIFPKKKPCSMTIPEVSDLSF